MGLTIPGLVCEYTLMQSGLGAIRVLINKMLAGWCMVRIVIRQLYHKGLKLIKVRTKRSAFKNTVGDCKEV